jgi:peptide-methionine (S)-S-oxide reductase
MLTPAVLEAYDESAPPREATATATFGLGCFWGPDAQFGAMEGVVRTRVGYAGGTEPEPMYHDLGDHTEVVQIDHDPSVVSYRDLVRIAFRSHDLDRQVEEPQYQSAVLTTGDQRAAVDDVLAERGRDVTDVARRVEPLSSFTPAESYHQKHALRSGTVPDAVESYGDRRLRESPAAAKLNGHARGYELPGDDLDVALTRRADD